MRPVISIHFVVGLLFSSTLPAAAIEMRSAMELDPYFEPETIVHSVPDRLIPLWLEQLTSSDLEVEVICQVARGLVRLRRLGIQVPPEATRRLADCLRRSDLEPAARLTVARGLVELDALEYAVLLISELERGNRDMAQIVEPALARWKIDALREEWFARLSDPSTSSTALKLAIAGLGSIREPAARTKLEAIATDRNSSPDIRIEAARALSQIADRDLEGMASQLLTSASADRLDQLIAVTMLSRHTGQATRELLLSLVVADDPAAAALAIERLLEFDATSLDPSHDYLLAHHDSKVRLLGVRAVLEGPSTGAITHLTAALDDGHPDVRNAAADGLIELAKDRKDDVGKQLIGLLQENSPRQTREAVLVLGAIDYEPAAEQMVELLEAENPKVSVAAAWGLERLAVRSTAEQMLSQVVQDTKRTVKIVSELAPLYAEQKQSNPPLPDLDATYSRVEHLVLALGQVRYEKASKFLRGFIPKPAWQVRGEPPSLETFKQARLRAAAIWALGKIHAEAEDGAPEDLVDVFVDRLADTTPIPREEPIVRQAAAVSLGRLRGAAALPTLQEFFESSKHDDIGRACGWAISQLTGKPLQSASDREIRHIDWFLVPLDP